MTYEEIIVGANETYTYSISNGEVWEDKLIDVTADGAGIEINVNGVGDWIIRNIGIRGPDSGETEKFMFGVAVPSGSTGIMENVYLGDGDEPWVENNNHGEAPVYCYGSHAGILEVRNVYFENHGDNGLYASDPGHSGNLGGEVHVYDTFAGYNQGSNIRLGTDGSFMENCCVWGGPHRGYWGYFEHTEIRNCHVGGGLGDRAVEAGEPAWDKAANAEITVIDSQIEGYNTRESTNEIHLQNVGFNPQEFIPEGTPTTPEEAVTGERTPEIEPIHENFEHESLSEHYTGDTEEFEIEVN